MAHYYFAPNTAAPCFETLSFMYVLVGWIFRRSVHQRICWFGLGYPLPMSRTQKVLSGSGRVRATVMGRLKLSAAA
ncbi:hypothetical protein DF018_36175 [Burkholderia cenocepacia]|nr:hypothetical protein DF018_36175 [Burkholderia cenocepacia]